MKTRPLNINEIERELLEDILNTAIKDASYSNTAVRRAGTKIAYRLLEKIKPQAKQGN